MKKIETYTQFAYPKYKILNYTLWVAIQSPTPAKYSQHPHVESPVLEWEGSLVAWDQLSPEICMAEVRQEKLTHLQHTPYGHSM